MEMSQSSTEIIKAMIKVQSEIQNPINSADNPFFHSKYSPLDEILDMIRPLMVKNKMVLMQFAGGDGTYASVTTMIMHESGEWIKSDSLSIKPAKMDAQGIGSAITYGRRYTLLSIFGIMGDDDDDGNVATHESKYPIKPAPTRKEEIGKSTTPASGYIGVVNKR